MSNKSNEQVKAIRFKTSVYEKLEQRAIDQGVTFNDALDQILSEFFELPQDPVIELNSHISQWLETEGYIGTEFPEDIIFLVFEMIRTTDAILSLYQNSVLEQGEGIVNRRIGLFVKQMLNADVKGRSVPFTKKQREKSGYLIKSYSFLKPSKSM
jgi:hypothetical protein